MDNHLISVSSATPAHPIVPPSPRDIGAVNWLGLRVLIGKEIGRFIKVYAQTLVAPVI
jgi:ABC-2 type transport system permease protein